MKSNKDPDEKYQEVKEKIAAIIKENKTLKAHVKALIQDRDYWRGIAQTGGRG